MKQKNKNKIKITEIDAPRTNKLAEQTVRRSIP